MARRISRAVAAVGLAAVAVAASAEEHVRGVVRTVSNDEVTVSTADGRPQKLRLQEKTRVSAATKADLGAIAKDAFVGTTAVEAKDGTLRAIEVHVFPEAMRGAGEIFLYPFGAMVFHDVPAERRDATARPVDGIGRRPCAATAFPRWPWRAPRTSRPTDSRRCTTSSPPCRRDASASSTPSTS